MSLFKSLACALFIAFAVLTATAQQITGNIHGTINDPVARSCNRRGGHGKALGDRAYSLRHHRSQWQLSCWSNCQLATTNSKSATKRFSKISMQSRDFSGRE